jgi:thymidylate synthase
MLQKVANASEAFRYFLKEIKQNGIEVQPRDLKCLEINGIGVVIENAGDNVINDVRRKMSESYLIFELLWYISADLSKSGTDMISTYGKIWDKLRNDDGSVNSNYGYYFFSRNEKSKESQFDYVVDKLKNDKNTRQAIVNINNIDHKRIKNCKDFPCTVSVQYFIRENKLNSIVNMRSTDLILGFCNDIYQFSQLQRLVLECLKETYEDLELGSITLFTNSLHLYENNYSILDDFYESFDNDREKYSYRLRDYSKDKIQIKKKNLDVLVELERIFRENRESKKAEILIEALEQSNCEELKDMLGIMIQYYDMKNYSGKEFGIWA